MTQSVDSWGFAIWNPPRPGESGEYVEGRRSAPLDPGAVEAAVLAGATVWQWKRA
jgi:hypothetical protein